MQSSDHLSLLFHLSQVFNSSLDLDEVLNRVMDEVIAAVHAERGFVMLYDAAGQLGFRAARGMDQGSIEAPEFQVSRGVVEQVVRQGVPVLTMNAQNDDRFNERESIIALGVRSILCVPLKSKDRNLGLIYVDSRIQSGIFTQADLDLFGAIASTAAIAIENASLFKEVRQSKLALEAAYVTTLEGWAHAIELRDQETEGHTRRVTERTVRFAQVLGIQEPELSYIHRGALLHDIGKMGVSDLILRKPGSLDAGERLEMQRHPQFAFEMLSPIEYLQPSIAIPYCHHEKWDGSGYPRAIKGEEIPFAARLFSIVDVWDALSSDRYYRKALPSDQVVAHLLDERERSFQANLVQAFIWNFIDRKRA